MEMHHKLRRDPSWDPRGCNLCGQVGHQAVECPNGTVNWKGIYGEDAFILRPPVYESMLRERRQYKTVDAEQLAKKAEEYAEEQAEALNISWSAIKQAAADSQTAQIQPVAAAPASKPEDDLPEGWAVAYDPTGKPYFWHKATQKTQWEKPTA